MKFPFIESYRERWPVKTMCRVLEVSTSGYYAWRCRPLSARSERDQELGDAIETVFAAHKSRYGSPRIHRELTIAGVCVGRKRVARIMCQRRLRAKAARRWRIATTTTDPSLAVAPNRLNRDFTAEEPGRVWLSDITYIPTRQGWLLLSRRNRSLHSPHRRLVDEHSAHHRHCHRRAEYGDFAASTRAWAHPPFRSWLPIRESPIPPTS